MEEDLKQKVLERTDGWTDSVNESSLDYDFMSRHPELSISFLVFTCVSVIFGNVGNIMVIGAVVTYKPLLRNKGSMFVINLAIADLCITSIVSPMNMVGVTHGPRYFVDRVVLCNILGSICTVSCIVSMLSIAAVAVNRAVQICCYFSYESIFTLKKTIGYCASLWFLAICSDLPNWLGPGGHTFALKEMGCTFDRSANYSYSVFIASMSMLLPMSIVLTSYLIIFRYIRVAREKYKAYLGQMDKKRKRDERQFAFTLFVSFMVFVLCWSVYMVAVIFDRHDKWPKQVYVYGTIIGHANSFLNPIIYATLNVNFRHGYGVFFKRLTCKEVPREAYLKERRHSTFKSSIITISSCRTTSSTDLRSTVSSVQHHMQSDTDIHHVQSDTDIHHVQSDTDIHHVQSDTDIHHVQSDTDIHHVQSDTDIHHVHSDTDIHHVQSDTDIHHVQSDTDIHHVQSDTDIHHVQSDTDIHHVQSDTDKC